MNERKVDVVVIGLVFAAMPILMQFGRMLFATLSDFWGRKLFFFANGLFGTISSLIYYVARTPLDFLFGKAAEGTKEGAIWAVNRPFLLEKNEGSWRALVHLRTIVYLGFALGNLVAGFLIVWLLFEGTMILCAFFGVIVVMLSLLLTGERKEHFNLSKAVGFLDFRRKTRIFKLFIFLFFVTGLSYGFVGGYVIPLFLKNCGFDTTTIGLIIGIQILVAGIFSYIFSKTSKMRQLILISGLLFSCTFILLSLANPLTAVFLVIFFGFVQGANAIGQEGMLSKVSNKESYGTDIGLLMIGLHIGETISSALAGLLIANWGFAAPFLIAALTYTIFYLTSYKVMD